MISLFLGLTAANLVCLIAATTLGYLFGGTEQGSWHMLSGVLAAITCIAVHSVVYTYFIATAKWVQHAVAVKKLDPQLVAPTRSFRAQAFPAALLAMATVFVAAVFGVRSDAYGARDEWHQVLALASIAINAAVAPVEYRAIARNGRLIDGILARIEQLKPQT